MSKQPEAGRYFTMLRNDIKNAKYLGEEKLNHTRNDGILRFHRLSNNNKEFIIAERVDGKKYYMSEIKNDSESRPSRVGTESSDSIITYTKENFNPSDFLKRFLGWIRH